MRPLVIYHDKCADGFGAAYAAWKKLGYEADYYPCNYGKQVDLFDTRLCYGRHVYILDFGFPKMITDSIVALAKHVTWLDHHKASFEKWCGKYEAGMHFQETNGCYGDGSVDIVLDDNRSGALLAWDWFHGEATRPQLYRHLDDYDRWQFKIEHTRPIQRYVWSHAPWTFEAWEAMLEYFCLESVLPAGLALERTQNQQADEAINSSVMPVTLSTLGGAKFFGLAANCASHLSNDVGSKLAARCGSFGLCWRLKSDGTVSCSIRAAKGYDVANIAKLFGGDGHAGAAGFRLAADQLFHFLGINTK